MKPTIANIEPYGLPDINRRKVVVRTNCNPMQGLRGEMVSKDFVICLVSSGTIEGYYDQQPVTAAMNDLAVILPNHLFKSTYTSDNFCMTEVVIAPPFMDEMMRNAVHRNYIQYHYAPTAHLTQAQADSLRRIIVSLKELSEMENLPHRHELLMDMTDVLSTLLSHYRTEYSQEGVWLLSRNNELYDAFCELLVRHSRESRQVDFYANRLHITSKHFTRAIREATGHPASYWIEQHIAVQAKQLLHTRQDMSVQEIGYYLGFDDAAHFTRYFKRVTGMAPLCFRETVQ